MSVKRAGQKALWLGAFVVAAALVLVGQREHAPPSGTSSARCAPHEEASESAVVQHVVDGDTLKLQDGRLVRLLGINTPEIRHDGGPSEPFAESARRQLRSLAPKGQTLALRFDQELEDRYQRALAHLYLPDGTSVQGELLRAGLATTLVVPPNVLNADCYAQLESKARAAVRGLWADERYQVLDAGDLPSDADGYFIVRGRVQRVGRSRSSLWLNLASSRVAIRIPRDDLVYFERLDPTRLEGQTVTARGWIHERNGELRMEVRHPAALEVGMQ